MDFPENHLDGGMQVLDIKVWINSNVRCPKVSHSFYKKPVSSPYTILKRSTFSESVKRSTIFLGDSKKITTHLRRYSLE